MASQTLPNRRRRRNIDFSKNRDGFLNNFFHSKFFNFCAVRVVVTACVGPSAHCAAVCCATPCPCPAKTRFKPTFYLFYDFGQFLKPVTDRLENPKNCQNCQNLKYTVLQTQVNICLQILFPGFARKKEICECQFMPCFDFLWQQNLLHGTSCAPGGTVSNPAAPRSLVSARRRRCQLF